MTTSRRQPQRCPSCGRLYYEHPAISRVDSRVEICPRCGTWEALAAWLGYLPSRHAQQQATETEGEDERQGYARGRHTQDQ